MAEWIISFLPPHHSYLEPFFGSGAVLFNKLRSNIETVNDLDNNVVNLFRWMIENMPAIELIKRFNFENVLIYCDPPYMLETRHRKQYRCEMDNGGHEALLKHKGYVVISGYDTELYDVMLAG